MTSLNTQLPQLDYDSNTPDKLYIRGHWTLHYLQQALSQIDKTKNSIQRLDITEVNELDSAGVLVLMRFAQNQGIKQDKLLFRTEHQALVDAISPVVYVAPEVTKPMPKSWLIGLDRLGENMHGYLNNAIILVSFLGESLSKLTRIILQPRRFRATATVFHMQQVGLDAIPLVALLSFLVGAVVAFLGATILRDFGAEIFVVELVSIAFLREFGVLLTAIVLAGRTASAFTAQIGAMKSREEVDAIKTLGLDPFDLLVIPRLLALLIMLPLLTFIAMMAGLLGGLVVGGLSLNIPPIMYIARLHDSMDITHFFVGLSKAPIFAFIIGLIGCLEGLKVTGTAQSVGERTTSSVVQAIALVIILDAFAAIWFMHVGW